MARTTDARAARAALDAEENAKFTPSRLETFERPRTTSFGHCGVGAVMKGRTIVRPGRPSTAPSSGRTMAAARPSTIEQRLGVLLQGGGGAHSHAPEVLELESGDISRCDTYQQLARLRQRVAALESQNAALKSKIAASRAAASVEERARAVPEGGSSGQFSRAGPNARMLRAEQERRAAAERALGEADANRAVAEAHAAELERELAELRAGQAEALAAQLRAMEMVRGSELAEAHRVSGMGGLAEVAEVEHARPVTDFTSFFG